MKIQVCSDLHLEFSSNRRRWEEAPLRPVGDILILAGDTYYLGSDFTALDFVKRAADSFEKVFILPGNHEYYGGFDAATAHQSTLEKFGENVFLVNNHVVKLKDVQLIFTTLWSRIERHIWEVFMGMADFRKIRYQGKAFSVDRYNSVHDSCFNFLQNAVKKEGKKIVITHHLPSYQCNAKEFQGSILNEGFCIDKTDFILKQKDIDYWIYGHSHRNMPDFKIGQTKMITNQFGYVDYGEQKDFNYEKIIEV